MPTNLASKYSNKIDERFYKESQALMGTNKDYEWNGVNSISVFMIDTVPLNDYTRSGANRYGTPSELGNTTKDYTLRRDKAFTFTIDKGNKTQSMMVMDAGKCLARELREVVIPEFDTYVFNEQAAGAIANDHVTVKSVSSSDAYATFLAAQEVLGNKNVPDVGRIAFCSYAFANLLMLDPAFMKYSDRSQEMVIKGVLGEVDGTKIVKVPASRLPYGCSFLIVHPTATVAPEQLKEYKTHQNPPGISGDLVEGRIINDAFVLEGKKDALYLCLGGGTLAPLTVASVAGSASGKTKLSYTGAPTNLPTGYTVYYKTNSSAAPEVTFGADVSTWTEWTSATTDITATTGHKFTMAIAYDGKAIAAGSGEITSKA